MATFPYKIGMLLPLTEQHCVRKAEFLDTSTTTSAGEVGGCAQAGLPPQAGGGLWCFSRPRGVPPPRGRAGPAWRGLPGPRRRPLQAAAGRAGGRSLSGAATVSEPEPPPPPPERRGAQSPRGTPSSPPATSQRPPEPPRRGLTPEAARPGPLRPSACAPRPAPAFTLERPRQPQQGRRRRIEELSRSSRERLLQSRDRMFSKFTSILQHAVEAVRPRAAGARQAGDGGGLRSPAGPGRARRPRPGPRRTRPRGGARPRTGAAGGAGAPGPQAWL